MFRLIPIWMLVLTMMIPLPTLVRADDEPVSKPETKEEEPEKEQDRFAIPKDATAKELLAFIKELQQIRPQSQEEYLELRLKAPIAMREAAEAIVKLEKDKKEKSEAYDVAQGILLMIRVQKAPSMRPAAQRELLDEVVKHLKSKPQLGREEFGLAMTTAQALERSRDPELRPAGYERLGKMLVKSETEQIAEYGKMMLGAVRRMKLVGNQLELTGTELEGEKFDIESLRGKVVLVDFWATWCGPCRQEFPNVVKHYEAYKDRGFEVVGVSIDQNRFALERYVEEQQVPWTTLHDKDGRNEALTHYGIFGIPAMFLVGKDGKVLSTQARGAELSRLLEKHIGPLEAESDADTK